MADRCIKSAKEFSDIDVCYLPALTPAGNPLSVAKTHRIPTQKFLHNPYSRGLNCLSCFLSHYFAWQYSEFHNEEVLIFEHDAVVRGYIDIDVEYKGLLSFGAPSYGKFYAPPNMGVNKLVSKQYLPGAHAYMVKPGAAKVMIEKAKKEAEPTDVFLNNARFDFLEEYWPWPVEVQDEFSTVQNERGVQAKHNYRRNPSVYRILKP